MNKQIIIVATVIFSILFIAVVAIFNNGLIGGFKDSASQSSTVLSANKYQSYLNHTFTGEEVLGIIDNNTDGYFYVYQPYRSDYGSTKFYEISLGKLGTYTTSSSTSLSNVYVKTLYNRTSGTNTLTTATRKYTTTSSGAITSQSLSDSNYKKILRHNYVAESVIYIALNNEPCGLVFREEIK
jgi:hypothetical protein